MTVRSRPGCTAPADRFRSGAPFDPTLGLTIRPSYLKRSQFEAARLMGATAILAGVSPEIAQTTVTLGIDLGRMTTVGDLQSGIERAE